MIKVFLAGGMVSNWQDEIINAFRDEKGIIFYDPRSTSDIREIDSYIWCLDKIHDSSVVLVYMESENIGGYNTMFEAGIAAAEDKTIIFINRDNNRRDLFGMLSLFADMQFSTIERAITVLKDALSNKEEWWMFHEQSTK